MVVILVFEYQLAGLSAFLPEFCKQLEQTAYHTLMNYIAPIYFYGTSLAAGYTEPDIKNNAKQHAERLIGRLMELKKIIN